ncbi:unnamed protein product [Staurois parvus]|uniref:Uncharacterized protein n=1 Tax=Staurois parvus TaxID=386267 RepID=A0ABN9D0A4_9NEOB|nr:unnamed protein product [Staurois parvus]
MGPLCPCPNSKKPMKKKDHVEAFLTCQCQGKRSTRPRLTETGECKTWCVWARGGLTTHGAPGQ